MMATSNVSIHLMSNAATHELTSSDTEGWERIPDNWYKRNVVDEYTIPYFSLDNLEMASQHPEFLSVGGNTGKVSIYICDMTALRRRSCEAIQRSEPALTLIG